MFDIIGQSKFYSRNYHDIHETNLETRFRENCFWIRVNEHFTPDVCYRINPDKYKICQVVSPVNQPKIMSLNSKTNCYKESRFSYIRPVDGITRLKVYNCSNITGLENVIHKSSQVIVEIPNGCMIVFTGDTYHSGVSTFERRNGSYPSNLRIFSYIVEDNFLSVEEDIKSIKGNMLCTPTSCQTCINMPKEDMFYTGHVIKYGMSKYGIENLEKGSILMGNLEKVGWVVLKSGYNIVPYGQLENAMYNVNNNSKRNWFAIDGKNLQMFYRQTENIHDSRFIDNEISQIHELLKIDCDTINLHLEKNYNFDINKKYKYYNPNLIRNNGQIKKDQVLHCDYKTSLIACPNDSKNNNQKNVESAIVPSPSNKKRRKNQIN